MSQHLRAVPADTKATWSGQTLYVRKGTIVDIPPGPALEAAYGGPFNLRPDRHRARGRGHSALANRATSTGPGHPSARRSRSWLAAWVTLYPLAMSATVSSWPLGRPALS